MTESPRTSLAALRFLNRIETLSLAIALAAAGVVLWFGLHYGARTAGGADSLGYVSQAYLWLRGDPTIEPTLPSEPNWPYAAESMAPLGYRPGATRNTIVPVYAPGVPLIMAGSVILCGACGPFYVGPVFAAMLVLLTWALAKRITGDPLASGIAAILMAASPTFLFNVVVPMSDIVTAVLWTGALVLLTWPGAWHAAVAGLVAGAAIVVRPNLVPLAVAGVLAAALWTPRERLAGRLCAFAGCVAPAVIAVALINNQLYGSPLRSGYTTFHDLFAVQHLGGNVLRYTGWLVESQSFVILIALVPLIIARARPASLTLSMGLPVATFVAILCASYFFYLEFDAWWFLRFFLVGFPLLFTLVGVALAWIARLRPAVAAIPASLVLLAILVQHSLHFVLDKGVRQLGSGEQRYAAVAEYIDRQLPSNAVVIAHQHTGSVAFYTGRMTLRYDVLPRKRLMSVVEWLQSSGYRPYIVLEQWEEAAYRKHFAPGNDPLSRLEIPVLAETTPDVPVRVFDPVGTLDPQLPRTLIGIQHAPICAVPAGAWRQ